MESHGIGIDLGTMNIVSARREGDSVVTRKVRDAFIDLDPEARKALRLSKINYIEKDGQIVVVGDAALNMANLFKREVRRPLCRGIISSGEIEAQQILALLIGQVLGKPKVEGEHCYYSVPAAPVDDLSQDVTYHTEIFRKIVSEHGYTPHPANEAMALVYSQCAEDGFSGLAFSYGAGMTNVALSYQTVQGLAFSVARAGDWIDEHAAKAVGSTAARICAIKERGLDLMKPQGREQEALALYTRALIRYGLENVAAQFSALRNSLDLQEDIPIIVSGGTSMAGGFMDAFKAEFEAIRKRFPIGIKDIRPASNPMTAVAEGLLVLALEEE